MTAPRAILFDLDGTLTVSKSALTSEMGLIIARLLETMPVAIMSGGAYHQFEKQFLANMPADAHYENLYLFPTSGAQCYRRQGDTWELVYDNPLSTGEKARILAALDDALAEAGIEQPSQLWGDQLEDRGSQITWSALGQEAPIAEKSAWDPDHMKREKIRFLMTPKLPECLVRTGGTTSVDVTKRGINKAYGVRQLSELLDIPISEMLYVGDALFPGGNDEIVKETGIPTKQVDGPLDTANVIESVLT